MASLEVALILMAGTNVALNISQHSVGWLGWFKRWYRKRYYKTLTITKAENMSLFYKVTQSLNSIADKLQHRTALTFSAKDKNYLYIVPRVGTEISIITPHGSLYVTPISLDGYTVYAYELACWHVAKALPEKDIINNYLYNLCQSQEANIDTESLKRLFPAIHPTQSGEVLVKPAKSD